MGASSSKTRNVNNEQFNIEKFNNRRYDIFVSGNDTYALNRSGNNFVTKYKKGIKVGRVGKNQIPNDAKLMKSNGELGNVTMGQRRNVAREHNLHQGPAHISVQ